jgi:hypothetical protein
MVCIPVLTTILGRNEIQIPKCPNPDPAPVSDKNKFVGNFSQEIILLIYTLQC